jgi:hypothetical protein
MNDYKKRKQIRRNSRSILRDTLNPQLSEFSQKQNGHKYGDVQLSQALLGMKQFGNLTHSHKLLWAKFGQSLIRQLRLLHFIIITARTTTLITTCTFSAICMNLLDLNTSEM